MLDGKANGHRCVNMLREYKSLVFAGRISFFEVVLKLEFCSTCHCAMDSLITFVPANLATKAIMEAACIAFIVLCIPELCSLDLDRSNVERIALVAFFYYTGQHCGMALATYHHYLAIGDGPCFFAPA